MKGSQPALLSSGWLAGLSSLTRKINVQFLLGGSFEFESWPSQYALSKIFFF